VKFSNSTTKQVLRVSGTSYFTERSGFNSVKIGNGIIVRGYFNITTQIPEGASFADLQQGTENIFGTLAAIALSDGKSYPVSTDAGNLKSTSIIPTGYYYIAGTAICYL
jgi:hypothetical protein